MALLFGGRSGEHEVSCVSARYIAAAMDPSRYQVIPIGITRGGGWRLPEASRRVLEGGPLELPERSFVAEGEPVALLPDPSHPEIRGVGRLDVVFPALHGPYGEDGCVQGLLETAGVPYVGSGVLGSALGMDKEKMKLLFRAHGLPTADFLVVRAHDWRAESSRLVDEAGRLGYPVFSKPANLGSSVGITKCFDPEELQAGIEEALSHDRKALVEEAIPGREIECALLGDEHPEASVCG
ncbi:MAG: D-alanine--D-alanine ligase family protein, partial [Candidatus Methylomirabilales bacterium]